MQPLGIPNHTQVPAEIKSLVVAIVLRCDLMTVQRIAKAKLTQKGAPTVGVHKPCTMASFRTLAINFSK